MATVSTLAIKQHADKSVWLQLMRAVAGFPYTVQRKAGEYGFDLYSRANQLLLDGSIVALSLTGAFLIRFEGLPVGADRKQMLLWIPCMAAIRLFVNGRLGVDRFIWRFVCLSDAMTIAYSNFMVTACLFVAALAYPTHATFSRWLRLPLSIIALEYLLSLSAMLSARSIRRLLYERSQMSHPFPAQKRKPVLLYGAGRAGIMLLRQLQNRGDIDVIGFVDEDPKKIGSIVAGSKVLSNGKSLQEIVQRYGIKEVIVSIVSASAEALAQILARCNDASVPVKIVPTLEEIVKERINISRIREFSMNDLLGREAVDMAQFDIGVRELYAGKRILVTGAGGSIGSELVRQLLLFGPAQVAILDKDENSIFELEQELKIRMPGARVEPYIADLRHTGRLRSAFADCRSEIVFHAAAHKHVPLMEMHPCEAVINNVYGTKNILDACADTGVERFVFISSDKAVNPINVMGATKRAGEKLVRTYAERYGLRAACVRFGNVMGSRGSIIPLFERQIAGGGPVTITHPEMVRFFMTIPEAVQLVLCAGTLAGAGTIYVLDMGSPRKVIDLVHKMITLCGLEPGKDIEIRITGLRPGEKLTEELVGSGERLEPTRFERISMLCQSPFDERAFSASTSDALRAAEQNNRPGVYESLLAMRLGFNPQHIDLHRVASG
jgi:FlaA1/EpsC-like NDP-sugar epimerase